MESIDEDRPFGQWMFPRSAGTGFPWIGATFAGLVFLTIVTVIGPEAHGLDFDCNSPNFVRKANHLKANRVEERHLKENHLKENHLKAIHERAISATMTWMKTMHGH